MGLTKTVLAIGIAIIFTVFIAYGVYVIFEPPQYYYEASNCSGEYNCYNKFIFAQCDNNSYNINGTIISKPYDDSCYQRIQADQKYQGCQELQGKCEEAFAKNTIRYRTARNSFYVLIVIGLAAIIGGIYFRRFEGIGSGFIGGGVLVILWSLPYTWEYLQYQNKYVKLMALGIVLIILVYLGYKKLEEKTEHKKR